MARVLEFAGTVVVTDMEVTVPEGTIKGHALREARYSWWNVTVLEPQPQEGTPEAAFAGAVLKATATYEAALWEERKKLEQAVEMAREARVEAEKKAQTAQQPEEPLAEGR